MGRKVIDVTKPWKRPNPVKGEHGEAGRISGKVKGAPIDKRQSIKDLGKGRVVVGTPWKKDDRSN